MNLKNAFRSIILSGAMLGTLYGNGAMAADKTPCFDTTKPCATVTKKITSPVPKLGSFHVLKHVGGKDLESTLRIHEGKNTVDMHSTNDQGKSLYQAICSGDYVKVTGIEGGNADLGNGYRIRTWLPSSPRNRLDQLSMVDRDGKITYERLAKSQAKAVNLTINKALYHNNKICASAAANVIVSLNPDCDKLQVVATKPAPAQKPADKVKTPEGKTTGYVIPVPDTAKPGVPTTPGTNVPKINVPNTTVPSNTIPSDAVVQGTPAIPYGEFRLGGAFSRVQLSGTDANHKELPALDSNFKGITADYQYLGLKNRWVAYGLFLQGDDASAAQFGVPQGSYNTSVSTKQNVTTLGARIDHTFSEKKVSLDARFGVEYTGWSQWNYFEGQTKDQSNVIGELGAGLKFGQYAKNYGIIGASATIQQVMDKNQVWDGRVYNAETNLEWTPNIFADFRFYLHDTEKLKVYLEGNGRYGIGNKTVMRSGIDELTRKSDFWNVGLKLGARGEQLGGFAGIKVAGNPDEFRNTNTGQTMQLQNNAFRVEAGISYGFSNPFNIFK